MATIEKGMQVDVREWFNLLESNDIKTVEEIQGLVREHLSATKEAWLLNSLVDYFYICQSEKAMQILIEVREPHDKHLVEKVTEGIKVAEHRLRAMRLLLHIVCKQPIWIHKILQQPVFNTLMKCLKTETDVPVLMTGVMVIVVLLPSVPVLIGPRLQEIFDTFSHLVAFNIKKPGTVAYGNVPDVFTLHLQVALYSLFHRLYGMFPYIFLTYLRHHYSKKENISTYEESIKPMLERVRLHPHLITGTREMETSSSRWRQMETQDVIVECAKMSLDMIEGTWEQLSCPVLSPRQMFIQSLFPKKSTSGPSVSLNKDGGLGALPAVSSPLELSPSVPPVAADLNIMWSPSVLVGLSTPPPSQRTTPATSLFETSASSFQQSYPGTYGNTPQLTPPVGTPRETPPIFDDQDKERHSSKNSSGRSSHFHQKGPDLKKVNTSLAKLQVDRKTTSPGVPPSPLKAEFTTEPPRGIFKSLPVKNAARELTFDIKKSLSPVPSEDPTENDNSDGNSLGRLSVTKETNGADVQDSESVDRPDLMESFSMDAFTKVMENMENTTEDTEDQEVSEITQHEQDMAAMTLTAESVSKFMKSVNRIRFNSMTASNNMESLLKQDKFGYRRKSWSCPQLPKVSSDEEDFDEPDHLSRSVSTTFKEPSEFVANTSVSATTGKNDSNSKQESDKVGKKTVEEQHSVVVTTSQHNHGNTRVTTTSSMTSLTRVSITSCPVYSSSGLPGNSKGEDNSVKTDFLDLLKTFMMPAQLSVCQKCKNQTITHGTDSKPGEDVPMFNSFSPPELLDKHLQIGGDIHAKELSKIPMTSRDSINWTHFGGMPPADEVNILRGQIFMMQNQIIYERNKRELHAKRNRRLLRKITNAKALEEQNLAKNEQIRMLETEIQNLQVSLKILQEENRRLKETKDSNEYERQMKLSACLTENQDLKSAKTEMNTLLVRQREEQDALKKKLQETEAKLFQADKEMTQMREQVEAAQKLKEQVLQLHRELLLMGELQQKYQEKLNKTKESHNAKPEQEILISTIRGENKALKTAVDKKNCQLDAIQHRNAELEESLKNKESSLQEFKKKVETVKISHEEELKAVEDKYQALMKVNQQLEGQILMLFGQLGQQDQPRPVKGKENHSPFSAKEMSPSRERTESDPSVLSSVTKIPLTQVNSVPLTRQTESHLKSPKVDLDMFGHGSVPGQEPIPGAQGHSFSSKTATITTEDNVSISSQESGLFHVTSRTGTLSYSEGEDRSHSSRGSSILDSGYSHK